MAKSFDIKGSRNIIIEIKKPRNAQVQIKSKILSILRVINVIINYLVLPGQKIQQANLFADPTEDFQTEVSVDYLINLLAKVGIGKEDYPVMCDVLKSMALMTKASVATIRDPSGYNDSKSHIWMDYFKTTNEHFITLLEAIGVDLQDYPKKEDYELAQKMVKALGESMVNEKEVRQMFFASDVEKDIGINRTAANRMGLRGAGTLYRGIHSLSDKAYRYATTVGNEWGLGNGVSTSMIIEVAEGFAEHTDPVGWSLIFIINNPKRQGFVADNLSAFSESEVILTGRLKVTKVVQPSQDTYYFTHVYADLI